MAEPSDKSIPKPSLSYGQASSNEDTNTAQLDDVDKTPSKPSMKVSASATDLSIENHDDSKSRLSREASPGRPQTRTNQDRMPSLTRSRRSSQDLSPSRGSLTPTNNLPSVPSAAAVQRALSATRIPHLSPAIADSTNNSRTDSPQWPVSPRLRSPPPVSRATPQTVRKSEPLGSDLQTPKLTTTSAPDLTRLAVRSLPDGEEIAQPSAHRSGPRGVSGGSVLEPVAEGSQINTPLPGPEGSSYGLKQTEEPVSLVADNLQLLPNKTSTKEGGESGTESGSGKSKSGKVDDRETPKSNSTMTASKVSSVPTKRSFTTLNPNKYRTGVEPSSRTMTVETETVSSIPQVSLGVGAGERGVSGRVETGGSVRLKPSTETIRPKKDKKRTARKPTSLNAGTVSSKADIFEAKVASAVDEATSSDSDETFVYESNPPDTHGSRQRHHSRTPSAASMASQADTTSSRYRSGPKDGQHSVAGKRSMKFTNSAYNNNLDGEIGPGSAKGNSRGGTITPRHHHIGRYGRGGHTSLFDNDSPFTQANRGPSGKNGMINASRLSRPSSPRVNGYRNGTPTRKGEVFDQDFDEDAADDERTPLVGSVRINRSRHARRPNSASLRQIEYLEQRDRRFLSRYGACIIVTLFLLIILFGAATFLVALAKPLTDVTVKHIQNVLASEQEIMLDLDVRATNPNLFAITVSDLNVDIFARSAYVRASHIDVQPSVPSRRKKNRINETDVLAALSTSNGGVDEGTDPIEDPEADPRTMLLGRIYEFDSPLIFDASPFRRKTTSSVGQVRLQKPGNKTEQGGTARWERVLQHSFELTVRGNIKYQLPLSSRYQSAQIQASIKVGPNEEDEVPGGEEVDKN